MGNIPKKLVVMLSILVSILLIGTTVTAQSVDLSSIENGEYSVKIDVLQEDKDEPSVAGDYIEDEATLVIEDEKATLKIIVPEMDGFEFSAFSIEGNEGEVDGETLSFTLNELHSTLNALVSYKVSMPPLELEHDDIGLRFIVNGLDQLPEKKEEEKEDQDDAESDEEDQGDGEEDKESGDDESQDGSKDEEETDESDESDEREVGELIQNPDDKESVTYVTDTPMIERYFDNPATLLYKDGKKYIQLKGNSAQFITSLTINGEEVTWGEISDDNTYTVQFELPGDLSEELVFGMTIDTNNPNFGEMKHEVSLSFEKDVAEDDEEKENEEPEEEDKESEEPKDEDKDSGETDEPSKNDDAGKENGNKEDSDDKKNTLVPDKAYEIDYVIKHKDGKNNSVANEFFLKPALILEKDGQKYVQLTISNGDMVKELKNKYGKALVVKRNSDGSVVVQLKVDNDLSDQLLTMFISVPSGAIPGFPGYNETHEAILSFKTDSLNEIDVKDHMLAGTSNKDNENGPFSSSEAAGEIGQESGEDNNSNGANDQKGPDKPQFGDKQDVNETSAQKVKNPKTGDTSKVMLYVMLLLGSLTPLALRFRRRFN